MEKGLLVVEPGCNAPRQRGEGIGLRAVAGGRGRAGIALLADRDVERNAAQEGVAQRLGGVFYQVDGEATQASILMTALSTSACQGDVMSEMHKALEDGRIDCSEHDALQTKIQDTMKMLRTLATQITQYCEGR